MLKLLAFLKPYWKIALLAPILMLIEVGADLLQPLLLASIVDYGIANRDLTHIIRTGGLMIVVAIVGMCGGFGCTIVASITSQGAGADLRTALFTKVQEFSFANLDKFKTPSLITRLTNDVTQIQNMVQMSLRLTFRAPLLAIGGSVMAIMINPGLAAILLAAIPVLVVSVAILMKKGFPLFSQVQAKLDRVNAVMRENLAGVRVVKAFVRGDLEKQRFSQANQELMGSTIQAARVMALAMPLIMLIMNLSIVAVLWFGGIQVGAGTMLVGEVLAFINYMMRILFALMLVAFVFVMITRAKASADRISEVFHTEVDIRDPLDPVESGPKSGEIRFENVSFHFSGAKGDPVLKDLSFTIEPGKTVAILGGTGSGKSTLVSLIPRLYDVTGGKVLVGGIDVRKMSLKVLRSQVAMVLQESVLFSGSIKDNIAWGKLDASPEEIIQAASMAQIQEFIEGLPEGYETQLGQRGVNLSGGQKQRLAIARALIKQPDILVLDDSTSAVDMGTELRILQSLQEVCKGMTVIIIAQRISSVQEADTIMVLEGGRIVARGTHDDLMKASSIYQEIYKSQVGGEVAV